MSYLYQGIKINSMSQDCLLLNGNGRPISYLPLSVITWKIAIKLTITRSVIVIKEHKDWVVRSPSVEMKVPSILMLQSYHPFHSYVKFSRSNVFLRDLYTCQYCFDIFEKKFGILVKRKFTLAVQSGTAALHATLKGLGVKKNLEKAIEWYELAANQNHKEAQFNLGIIFLGIQLILINLTGLSQYFLPLRSLQLKKLKT